MSEKTEEPTPKRLREAREKGDSPISSALIQAVSFTAVLIVAPAAILATAETATRLLHAALSSDGSQAHRLATQLAAEVLKLVVPMLAIAALASAATALVQSGGVIAVKKLSPDLSRSNPFTGIKNLITWQRIVSTVRALVAAAIVGWLTARLLLAFGADFASVTGRREAGASLVALVTRRLAWTAAGVGLALGLVDLLLVRRAWTKRNRMSKDEVKREHKESDGDPEVKAARQRAHQEMLRGATIASVRKATVVVVNPTHLATALRYEEEETDAPEVVAQGRGELARSMIDAARHFGVPVIRDVPVAQALQDLEVGDQIPEALYEVVAEILRAAWDELEDAPAD